MSLVKNLPRILIVDDNRNNLEVLSETLARAGFQVAVAIDGENALEQIKYYQPEIILLDVMMPNLDGFETCKLLKQNSNTCNIPIILITALTETEVKVRALKLGVNDYITKPFESSELLARIESQLKSYNSPQSLAQKNQQLQQEINQKYEAEIALLEINEQLLKANSILQAEIKQRKFIEEKLQAEVLERQQAEKAVIKSLKEKELLLKEIHHRVKNNLCIVSSLLEFQADFIDNPQIVKMICDSKNRVMTMALIHEELHSQTNLSRIDFQHYVTTLSENLINYYLSQKINLTVNAQQVYLNIETANSCGLIINELISNAVEHAFPGDSQGDILLEFTQDDLEHFTLKVKDDGIGFTDVNLFYESESLGINLVTTLVEQLEGKLEVKSDCGTEVKITFKELNYRDRI